MVLLKNSGATLPVAGDVRRIALMGPMADNRADLMGSWWGQGEAGDVVTILEGVKAEFAGKARIDYVKGCDFDGEDRSEFARAAAAARAADLVVLCVGEKRGWSGRERFAGQPRAAVDPGGVRARNGPHGAAVVVLLSSGRPVDVRGIEPAADALVEIWQPGTEGGSAVAQLLSGKVNPSGRLAITFPVCAEQQPVYYNQRQAARPKSGRYQNLRHEPMYPFGYGLSYTTFTVSEVSLDKDSMKDGESIRAAVTVKNTGTCAGTETIQLYLHDVAASVVRPVKELKDFRKVTLQPEEEARVEFTITEPQLCFLSENNIFESEAGIFEIFIGTDSTTTNKAKFTLEKQ